MEHIDERGGCEIPPKVGEWGVQVYDSRSRRVVIRNISEVAAPLPERDVADRYVVIHPDDAEVVAGWILEMARAIKESGFDYKKLHLNSDVEAE